MALGSGLVLSTFANAEAKCRVPNFKVGHGKIAPVEVVMEKDTGCRFNVYADSGILDGVRLIVRPRHGRFGKDGEDSKLFAYIPKPGFVGEDTFAIHILYFSHATDRLAWSEVRYNVKVMESF